MTILVIGTGSIGRRHIANLIALGADVSAFSYRGSRMSEPLPGAVRVWDNLDEALLQKFDGVVVANRTDLHIGVALKFARTGAALFIEKPLSNSLSGVAELQDIVRDKKSIVETGFMLRFHPNLRWIKEKLTSTKLGKIHYIRAAVGQYLPGWRHGTDHRTSYSAKREFGGGVIFDLVHELDLVRWMVGEVDEVVAMTAHEESLEVETESLAQIGLRCVNGVLAQIHLDYLRPTYARTMEIVGSQGTLSWDYLAGQVILEKPGENATLVHQVPEKYERNNMFKTHMGWFLQRINDHKTAASSSLDDGVAALRLALACHASAERRQFTRPTDIEPSYRVTSLYP